MADATALLREMVALQRASIRLQKLSIALQAELLAYASSSATGPAIEKRVMAAVRQMRATADRVEAGKKLPR